MSGALALPCWDSARTDKVKQQDRPKDRDVEDREEGHHERDAKRFGERVPEFELGQPSNEGAELVVLGCRKRRAISLRVALRRQEADQQVEHVDSQPVGDDVPA